MSKWNVGRVELWNVAKMRLKTFFQYSNILVEKTFWLVCAVLFALDTHGEAQQPGKVPRDRVANWRIPFQQLGPHAGI